MRLLLASRGDINNPRNWSGTPKNLLDQFRDTRGVCVESMNWQVNRNILRIYHRLIGKFCFVYGTARDPVLSPFCERRIAQRISKLESLPDFLLFISDYSIPDAIFGKTHYAAYFDSFLDLQIQYFDDRRRGLRYWRNHYDAKNRECLERMTVVFTQNEWTRQCLLDEYVVVPQKVHNVGFGINTEPYLGEKDYENDLLLIVLRKGTEKYKGLLLLLEAFKILKQRRFSAKLAVVGTELADRPEGVTYYFDQPRSVTVDLFHQATLYVMPAIHEPNGITYLEALANKTPIVGLNRFAVPEFCNYGQWGFMVENEDPEELAVVLEQALDDKERLRRMGEEGQAFVVNRYRWEIVAWKMLEAMREHLVSR